MSMSGLCGVILAAGESSRMGRDKALLPWPPASSSVPSNETFLSAAISSVAPFSDMVFVVAGRNAPELASIVFANGADLVTNPAPERGQFSSLRIGLHEVLRRGRDAAIVTLVDRPPVSQKTIHLLVDRFNHVVPSGKWAVVPEYKEKHGHPVVIGRDMIEAFLKAPESSTARDVEHSHAARIEYVPIDDPFLVLNVNTPGDYAALSSSTVTDLK